MFKKIKQYLTNKWPSSLLSVGEAPLLKVVRDYEVIKLGLQKEFCCL